MVGKIGSLVVVLMIIIVSFMASLYFFDKRQERLRIKPIAEQRAEWVNGCIKDNNISDVTSIEKCTEAGFKLFVEK